MKKSLGLRSCAALVSFGALGLAAGIAGPAAAATAPTTPTELFNGYTYCSTDAGAPTYVSSLMGLTVEGLAQDPADAPGSFTMQFQVYPVGDPTQVTTVSNAFGTSGRETGATVPQADLLDGQVYAWQAQAVGSGGASGWSAPCYMAIDNTRPGAVPTVTSANYPSGVRNQAGTPIQVTFGANGVGDVAGYVFSWNGYPGVIGLSGIGPNGVPQPENPWSAQPGAVYSESNGSVQAPTLGGPVTVDLIPPEDSGYLTLTVESVDRTYSPSATTRFDIFVKPDAPTITLQGDKPKFGVQTPYLLTPDPGIEAASPVTSYRVVDFEDTGQQVVTVPADANGAATLHLTDTSLYGIAFMVQSVSADGWVSMSQYSSYDTFPLISSDTYPEWTSSGGVGVPGTFTFSSPVKGIASFSYTIDGGPATTVHAADGRAQITFTPTDSTWYDIEVTPIAKDGTQLYPNDYYFGVN